MFDRYPGDNKTQLAPEQKLYLDPNGGLVIPALNLMSLLSAQNTESAPKILYDPRKYKSIASNMLMSIRIQPELIPILRNGKQIKFGQLGSDGKDKLSGVYVHRSVARLDKGIPNPKERPVLPLPWSLKFEMTIYPNDDLNEDLVFNTLLGGGQKLGLGTFRKVFGRFDVDWE
jgi:hypothetical protein